MKKKLVENCMNRYGDQFTFTYDPKVNPDLILWEGNFEYCRYGWENNFEAKDLRYNMVDPSGGPYVSSGMDCKLIIEKLKGKYIDYLSPNLDEDKKMVSINIHLKDLKK